MRFAHTNIGARDWKSLSEFYIRVFGCTVKPPERDLSGEWLDRGTGLENARLRGVHLLLPGHGERGPTLEIFTYDDPHIDERIMPNHTGFTHIAFEVDDVARTLDEALKNGGTPLGQITERAIAGAGFLRFVYFRDPEGNIVEIQSWSEQAAAT